MLPDDELRGVIAHEMSHIKNRDILVMSITAALASIVSYMARMLMWMVIFAPSGGRDDNSRIALIAVAIAAQILVPIAAILVQLGISRNREYLADETGAKMINDPRALARALDHLEKGNDFIQAKYAEDRYRETAKQDKYNPANDYDYAHMYIANPLKKGSLLAGLFSTHPPMEERIARLNRLADKMGL
jgi:heat shock protein HtpX